MKVLSQVRGSRATPPPPLILWRVDGPSRPPPAVLCDLGPTGTLRAAINFGNPVLAQRDPVTGSARGVTPALARELASRLGVPLTLVPFESAGKVRRLMHCACMWPLGKGSHGDVVASKSVVTPCAGRGWVLRTFRYHEGCTEWGWIAEVSFAMQEIDEESVR